MNGPKVEFAALVKSSCIGEHLVLKNMRQYRGNPQKRRVRRD